MIEFKYDDGGRSASGFKGNTGDCVTRSISIVTGKPYLEVYNALNELSKEEKVTKRKKKISNARTGVHRATYQKYLESLGWKFVSCMGIGTGVKVHLRADELPSGRIICRLSKHLCAVIDKVVRDTYDGSRGGTRAVYGYFIQK
jgi:hypothetical protein